MAMESSFKNMVIVLSIICLICSTLLAAVFALTKEPIAKAEQDKLANSIALVVPEFEEAPVEKTIKVADVDYKYFEVSAQGNVVAYAIEVAGSGFSGQIKLMVGIGVDGIIFNTSVLSQTETPGLGAKCIEPFFADQFKNFNPKEKKLDVTKDGGSIDAITASTITSRAYTNVVKTALNVYTEIIKEAK